VRAREDFIPLVMGDGVGYCRASSGMTKKSRLSWISGEIYSGQSTISSRAKMLQKCSGCLCSIFISFQLLKKLCSNIIINQL